MRLFGIAPPPFYPRIRLGPCGLGLLGPLESKTRGGLSIVRSRRRAGAVATAEPPTDPSGEFRSPRAAEAMAASRRRPGPSGPQSGPRRMESWFPQEQVCARRDFGPTRRPQFVPSGHLILGYGGARNLGSIVFHQAKAGGSGSGEEPPGSVPKPLSRPGTSGNARPRPVCP
jgi:hypothetical protein